MSSPLSSENKFFAETLAPGGLFVSGENEPQGELFPEKEKYLSIQELKPLLQGKKYLLDCGHKITFGHHWANNAVIIHGESKMKIICTECYQ